ncbi:acyl-CoA dehydrogenase family protein [Nocardia terpenica]|uniref:acyl-CoA dehydrogenase family protein n=1 Tax=Nocardia terpenica TaxID=455432 RepID=UPI0018943EFA|nr:acyl-CoA dehydrogenase family protein [Nocardia terpenica]MBF6063301.1 acyl-CoA dehydrogenase family protein [Nocardia terpenica]MBF6105857.1 acyl-CoA dehydrogenase family protein [Nocardia terpenica]MBF6113559.1 acyl-CoA dehydrogenase family protein [Nocardia terpenica]MBF6119598.1 acyl-CoA dehydrogenase family protein [Nocardia terpenica]MBF6152009.1 acyl-CoA dehydrogenase family protein [Nocardia terpenica]
MDFTWPEESEQVFKQISTATQEWTAPEDGQPFTREQWRRCAELGLLGLCVPTRYGGQGYGFLTSARAVEAFGRGCTDLGLVFSASAHLFAATMPIVEFGGEALRERVLPKLCSGEWVGANAITEEGAGSDAMAGQARAVRDGDGYRITGTKSFVSNGPAADVFIVYAHTDPSFGHMGLASFVVERETEGVSLGPSFDTLAFQSCPTSSLVLEDAWVPAEHMLGREGQGATVFHASMRWERSCLFAAYLGQMSRVLDRCVDHAKRRKQFGRRIGANQAVSHRIAELQLNLEAARLLLYRACWRLDRGEPATTDIAMAKLAVSRAAVDTALSAVRLFAGLGVRTDVGIEQELRNAVPSTIFSGTSEMHLEMIAKELGL